MRRLGSSALVPVLAFAALLLLAPLLSAPASSASAAGATRATSRRRDLPQPARAHRFPGTARSTAAPTRPCKGGRRGDQFWYLYCTTDPLNDEDVDGEGDLRFHPIPMMRSRDLVNWTYVGDALPEPPAWAADGAGLWAPDVVYSPATESLLPHLRRHRHRRLAARAESACASTVTTRSASRSATARPGRGRCRTSRWSGPAPGPAVGLLVLLDLRPRRPRRLRRTDNVLYYGSYYGGVHAVDVAFDHGRHHDRGPVHAGDDRQPLRGHQRRQARRLVLPVRLRHQLLQRAAHVVRRLRRPVPQSARSVRRPRRAAACSPGGSAARRCCCRTATAGSASGTTPCSPTTPASGGRSTTPSTEGDPYFDDRPRLHQAAGAARPD